MTEVEWSRFKAHELRDLANRDAVVILPVASMEQHGPHLPVQVDSRIAFDVCRAAARIAAPILAPATGVCLLPAVWTGLSEHHMSFGGTITLDYNSYFLLLRGIVGSITRHGFKRILIVNGHGGNISANKIAVQDLSIETGATIVETVCWMEAGAEIAAILEDQPSVMHAGEAETSVMMYLTPDLVDDSNLAAMAQPHKRDADPTSGSHIYRWRPFSQATTNGVIGNPTRASAAKGQQMFEIMAEKLAARVTDAKTWAPLPDIRLAETGGVALREAE